MIMESREEYYETELEQEVVGFSVSKVFDYTLCFTLIFIFLFCALITFVDIREWYFRRRMEKATKLQQEKDKKINKP